MNLSSKKNNIEFLIKEDSYGWMQYVSSNIKNFEEKIQNVKVFYKNHPECKEIVLQYIENEKLLVMNYLKLYYKTLEFYLIDYLNHNQNYNQQKILEDFLQIKEAIVQSINNLFYNIVLYIQVDDKNPKLIQNIDSNIKQWYKTYYILIFDLFYYLPVEFRKEWFKKFKL